MKDNKTVTLAQKLVNAIVLDDEAAAERKIATLLESPDARLKGDGVAPALSDLMAKPNVRALVAGLADHSPFLWRLCCSQPKRLAQILSSDPADNLSQALAHMTIACAQAATDEDVMAHLRKARAHAALLIALADLGGVWALNEVTGALTRAADAYVQAALDYLLRKEAREKKIEFSDFSHAQNECGMTILALGKHGAGELNYSSDVDLVIFYDAERAKLTGKIEPGPFYVKVTKALARLLSERTGDGYVLRVDLRLRPDPGSTVVAVALAAALFYYEIYGQNWERAAMIKARPVAGDRDLGVYFLDQLKSFIWRRYFDYAAIADIHAMKRQIHAVRGHCEVAIMGHDVKLGRGGIREIEFFVQTQQLIFGGRRAALRGARTLDMLAALAADGWVTPEARDELASAYDVLRRVEHRLQMIADEQTQRLPRHEEELTRFAKFCGFKTHETFGAWLSVYLLQVEKHYSRLFESAEGLDSECGNLVFTGAADDPDTLKTLTQMGFAEPEKAIETVRGWHFGRRAAVQSVGAREILTELIPSLMTSLGGAPDPDAALAAFDQALTSTPAAVQLFSVLKSNKNLRDLFADVLGAAPRLAAIVSRRPHVLDAVIDPAFFGARLDRTFFDAHIARLHNVEDTEEFLDMSRMLAQEAQFAIGVRVLSGVIEAREAGPAFSDLAEAILDVSLRHVEKKFAAEHGRLVNGSLAVAAMGRLGSREMTATSDLDLVIIYGFDENAPDSDGRRPLHAVQYYTRLTQRFISVLTASTRRGPLYEVDMRLRPSGKKGPIAVQKYGYFEYHRKEAEIWEHMALTRSRTVCGDPDLMKEITVFQHKILSQPRDEKTVAFAIAEMREMIATEKGDSDPADIKIFRGGIIDLEFFAQCVTLTKSAVWPKLIEADIAENFDVAEKLELLSSQEAELLKSTHRFFSDLIQLQRIILPETLRLQDAPEGVRKRIAAGVGLPDEAALAREISDRAAMVAKLFRTIVEQLKKNAVQ